MRFWFSILPVVFFTTLSVGQEAMHETNARPDTIARDTLAAVKPDTTASTTGIDTMITYSSADSIVYDLSTKTMELFSKGQISYQDLQLKADRIGINWNTSTMVAHGVTDTSDTAKVKVKGSPVMKDGNEEYRGSELAYNFRTRRGKINIANTTIDQGYYHGETIKKVDKDVLFVAGGRYTTCDAPEPHYYFFSPKMKVVPGDKVVGEPVYLYVADVPIFALPFGVFPNQRGRRSGIIAPAYGENQRGRYLAHLGYYLAISDYMDANLRTDLYSKGGWALYSDYHYKLLYYFSGGISGNYKRLHLGEENDPQRTEEESYSLSINHSEDFDPSTRLSANFNFASDNSYRTTNNLDQALSQFLQSSGSFWHTLDDKNSITLGVTRSQDLRSGNIEETLPSMSFNHSQSYPFRWGKKIADEENTSWLEDIGFDYSVSAQNRRSKINTRVDSIRMNIGGIDTLGVVEEYARNRQQDVSQSGSLTFAPKLGYFTLAPFFNYSDSRTFTDNDVPTRDKGDTVLYIRNDRRTDRSGVLSTGISTSTKLYGIVQPGVFGITAIRHTMSPRLTFSYNKKIIGDDPVGRQMLASLGVGNLLEMKTNPTEEGKEGNKIQLLNLGADISYNFSIDSLNFSPLRLSYRTSIGRLLDIDGGMTYSLYKLVQVGPNDYRTINTFLLSDEKRLARLTDFSLRLSTSLSGEKKTSAKPSPQTDSLAQRQSARGVYAGVYGDEEPDFSIPWQLSLSFDYAENKVPPSPHRSANMQGSLEFNLTENWKFSMHSSYDLITKEIIAPQVNITRDLHCWLMSFTWVPIGNYRNYHFEIRVKAPQLQDLKVTKSGSERGIY
ncbi:MAG: LPS-assembly protein LptD [Ignavibacteriae bacterium]|nr:LPS-assembly protein LptD [Ignavibacteria bacterium]MBI3363285.1 LPS-assembly protein LptD [Ignavibacteriota bacterium]